MAPRYIVITLLLVASVTALVAPPSVPRSVTLSHLKSSSGRATALHAFKLPEMPKFELPQMPKMPEPPPAEKPAPGVLVSSLPEPGQQAAVAAVAVLLCLGTSQVVHGLDFLEDVGGGAFAFWERSWPVGLGVVYAAAGVSHFTNQKDYAAIVPPPATWGFFPSLPYPQNSLLDYATFAVVWTGVAELGGGSALLASAFGGPVPQELAAFALLALTVAVTPANVYMFTHDAEMGSLPAVPYPAGHIFRGALQCVLLAFLWKLALH